MDKKKIVLSTLNSRYQHSSFGLRYLKANMGALKEITEIQEFVIGKNNYEIVEKLLISEPTIIGFGVYIWNTDDILEIISIVKKIKPEIKIILGGPEISYEIENQKLYELCDYVIPKEADFVFPELCLDILSGKPLTQKIVCGDIPDIKKIKFPYDEYTDEDIKNRMIYVEASRGCPFKCEYCLSSLDTAVRNFDVDSFLVEMDKLINRGVREFKFVDRTFNLSPRISIRILEFFYERVDLNLFLHFEMVPDRLPDEIKDIIKKFPSGSLQFEVGIQTWNENVSKNVSRKLDIEKIKENFIFLKKHTFVHTHADLIVGLPGESLKSFATGFDALSTCEPDEIQVGILKRLKGTPIIKKENMFDLIFSEFSPYQILSTKDVSFEEMQKMNRFAKYWDLIANSGNFNKFMVFVKASGLSRFDNSLFYFFYDLSEFLYKKHGQSFGISRGSLMESLKEYLVSFLAVEEIIAKELVSFGQEERKILFDKKHSKRQLKHLES